MKTQRGKWRGRDSVPCWGKGRLQKSLALLLPAISLLCVCSEEGSSVLSSSVIFIKIKAMTLVFIFIFCKESTKSLLGVPLKIVMGTGSGHKLVVKRPVPSRAEEVFPLCPCGFWRTRDGPAMGAVWSWSHSMTFHISVISFTHLPSTSFRLRLASFLHVGPVGLEDEMPCVVDSAAKSTKQYTVRIHPVSSLQMPSKNTL